MLGRGCLKRRESAREIEGEGRRVVGEYAVSSRGCKSERRATETPTESRKRGTVGGERACAIKERSDGFKAWSKQGKLWT